MWKYFSFKNTLKWVDVFPKHLDDYSKAFQQSIKMVLSKVNKSVEKDLWNRLNLGKKLPEFKIGDTVRISKTKIVFEKDYLPN